HHQPTNQAIGPGHQNALFRGVTHHCSISPDSTNGPQRVHIHCHQRYTGPAAKMLAARPNVRKVCSSVSFDSLGQRLRTLLPGILLAVLITAIATGLARLQEAFIDHAVLEPLVLALILGLVVRAMWTPPDSMEPGIAFSGKQLLEFAI